MREDQPRSLQQENTNLCILGTVGTVGLICLWYLCLWYLPAGFASESCGDAGAGGEDYACTNLDVCGTAPINTPCTGTLCIGDPKDVTQQPGNNQGLVSAQGAGPTCLKKEPCVKYKQGHCTPSICSTCTGNTIPPECNTCYTCVTSYDSGETPEGTKCVCYGC